MKLSTTIIVCPSWFFHRICPDSWYDVHASFFCPEGTALGANETLTAAGIALGNRVKMRGYVDFIYRCR